MLIQVNDNYSCESHTSHKFLHISGKVICQRWLAGSHAYVFSWGEWVLNYRWQYTISDLKCGWSKTRSSCHAMSLYTCCCIWIIILCCFPIHSALIIWTVHSLLFSKDKGWVEKHGTGSNGFKYCLAAVALFFSDTLLACVQILEEKCSCFRTFFHHNCVSVLSN